MSTSVCSCPELTVTELMARVRKVTKPSLPAGAGRSSVDDHGEAAAASDTHRVQAEFNRRLVESLDSMAGVCAQMQARLQSVQDRLQAAEATSLASNAAMADDLRRAEGCLAHHEERIEDMVGQVWDLCRRLDDLMVCVDAHKNETATSTESKPVHWGWWSRLQGLWLRA